MRFVVAPAELHTAAGQVSLAADLAGQARDSITRNDTAGWCSGQVLATAVQGVLDELEWAARRAEEHGRFLSGLLVAAALGYEDADTPAPR